METKNNVLRLFIICLLLILIFNSCLQKKMKEKFDWSATISAPMEYPVQVLNGYISSEDFQQGLDFGIVNKGWGNSGGTMLVGPDTKHIPDSLMILWLSLAEKKIYKGEFKLPEKKILSLFEKGFMDAHFKSQQKATYDTFVIGLGPGGRVVIWLGNANGNMQVEVARFQAEEEKDINSALVPEGDKYIFEPDYISFTMDNELVITPEVRERIGSHGYPNPDLYDSFLKKYNWIPEIRLPKNCKLTYLEFEMCNGEREFSIADVEKDFAMTNNVLQEKNRAIPYLFFINWIDQDDIRYTSRIVFTKDQLYWHKYKNGALKYLPLDFSESEIRKNFLSKIDKQLSLKIVFDIRPTEENIIITLQQIDKFLPIKEEVSLTGKI